MSMFLYAMQELANLLQIMNIIQVTLKAHHAKHTQTPHPIIASVQVGRVYVHRYLCWPTIRYKICALIIIIVGKAHIDTYTQNTV